MRVSIVGGSGYAGGELLRLLLDHPHVDVTQVTSERNAGSFVHFVHPNLRGQDEAAVRQRRRIWRVATFCFCACPMARRWTASTGSRSLAEKIVDLSADFRLRDPDDYVRWYGKRARQSGWLDRFVYGLPELARERHRCNRSM